MNPQIRKLSILAIVMMLALALAASWVQFVAAPSLNSDSRNVRTIYRQYGQERGQILAGDTVIARSVPVDDNFKYLREYPQGPTYAHITGYFPTGLQGMSTGLELVRAEVLTGSAPSLFMQRLQDLVTGKQQRGGYLQLTIDPQLQAATAQALAGKKGAAVVLRPQTGEILAEYSAPSFDPNTLSSHDSPAARNAYNVLISDPGAPLVDRTISGNLYSPGSVFKIITAAAMLSSGQYHPDTVLDAPTQLTLPQTDKKLINYGGEACGSGRVAFTYAFAQSCNTPFAAETLKLGTEAITKQAEAFGFGKDLSTPLTVTPSQFPAPESPALLAYQAIGQGSVIVSPMQMAMVAAAIANQGKLMQPYLIDRELTPTMAVTKQYAPKEMGEPVNPQVAGELTQMMIGVVNQGTGRQAALPGVQVAGKTGTAERGDGGPNAWFVGFAPATNPQLAIAVVIDGGEGVPPNATGAYNAAPIARQILQAGLMQ